MNKSLLNKSYDIIMTIKTHYLSIFATQLSSFKVISFNHQNLPLEKLALLHLSEEVQTSFLGSLKRSFGFNELMLLSTCNRVEFFICTENEIDNVAVKKLVVFINSNIDKTTIDLLANSVEIHESENAIEHVFEVASSLKSLVVGEREIITQVRKAYEFCNILGLTGDFIRMVVKHTIEAAKDVFTNTEIAKNPVSIVSLAYRQLRDLGIKNDARIVMIGTGETNTTMASYLKKHKYANFAIFNRTLTNAEKLATQLDATFFDLKKLSNYKNGFDVLITCTGSTEAIINTQNYDQLLAGDTAKKVIIDLALPVDVDNEVLKNNNIHYISINSLKTQAEKNLALRHDEIDKCKRILNNQMREFKTLYNERKVELAFGEIPKQVKAIKDLAINEVFLKEINSLDDKSKEVLDKVLSYVEKKYNAVAMKTAKDVLLNKEQE
jgi:glutamyl-tRNA reductase